MWDSLPSPLRVGAGLGRKPGPQPGPPPPYTLLMGRSPPQLTVKARIFKLRQEGAAESAEAGKVKSQKVESCRILKTEDEKIVTVSQLKLGEEGEGSTHIKIKN